MSAYNCTAVTARARMLAAPLGTAVVTMTSTASTDNFLAYRVGLVTVQLQASSGNSGLTVLPAGTSVDFATLTEVGEVLGAASVTKGTYTGALITLAIGMTAVGQYTASTSTLSATSVTLFLNN